MIRKPTSFASAVAMAAAICMAATPATAAEMPAIDTPADAYLAVNTGDAGEAHQYRRYRRHRDRGIDAGDVVAGVVVLGALAAIIGSSNSNRDRDARYDRRDPVRYDDRQDRGYDSRGMERAVDMCIDAVEDRDRRVEDIEEAQRSASGWNVSGTLSDGERWTCFIDNAGEIRSIDHDAGGYAQAPTVNSSRQLSDAAYRNARATTRTAADVGYSYDYDDLAPSDPAPATVPRADGPRPAYPGGPLPGEEGYDDDWQTDNVTGADEDGWEDDGRYTTAEAPDFEQTAR